MNPAHGPEPQAQSQALAHRRVLSGFTLAMMALSWPIWTIDRAIPRFPFESPVRVSTGDSTIESISIISCLAGLGLACANGRAGRIGAAAVACSGLVLISLDQNRLQAWFYQTLVLSAVYALLPAVSALGFVRFFAVTLYVHSALSKLDWSFAHSMGPYLLSPVLDRLPLTLDETKRMWLALALPIGELGFATALAAGFWRIGLAGASLMHLGLLGLLGPWALDHSGNVLLWNVSMLAQAWILFRPVRSPSNAASDGADGRDVRTGHDQSTSAPAALGLVQLGLMAVAILPFFERAGLWDPWPSFALYAGHVEQLRIDWPRELEAEIPSEFRPFLKPDRDDLVLDLTRWSRARFGVPPYPAERVHRRLAAWIAAQCPDGMPMRATLLSKAHWRTGARTESIRSSARSIREP